jgi:hypothetical protein
MGNSPTQVPVHNPAGKFQGQMFATECTDCGTQKMSPAGATTCYPCIAGRAGNDCTDCTAGRYSGPDASECTDCMIGMYQPDVGLYYCLYCGWDSGSDTGATACIDCVEDDSSNDFLCMVQPDA